MQQPTRIAVVGYGLIGRRHAAVVQRLPELDLCAVVEPSEEGRAVAREQGLAVYETIEAMLDEAKPQGIVLATPTPVHPEQCLHAIAAGVPTLVEATCSHLPDELEYLRMSPSDGEVMFR